MKALIEQAKTSDNPESLVFEKAMYRSDIGYIDIKWGTPGRGNKFKGGYGLSHIIEKRNAETGDGEKVVYQIVEAIAKATRAETQYSNQVGQAYHRIRLHYNGITAVLSKEPGNNHWLLTGWNENETEASASGEVHDSSAATAVTPTRTRRNGDATVSDNNIAHSSEESNTSEEKNPDAVDWEGNREQRLSVSDESKAGYESVEHISPREIVPRNDVEKDRMEEVRERAANTTEWQGRPMFAYERAGSLCAITGSHRLAVARLAGYDVDAVVLRENELADLEQYLQEKHTGIWMISWIGWTRQIRQTI